MSNSNISQLHTVLQYTHQQLNNYRQEIERICFEKICKMPNLNSYILTSHINDFEPFYISIFKDGNSINVVFEDNKWVLKELNENVEQSYVEVIINALNE